MSEKIVVLEKVNAFYGTNKVLEGVDLVIWDNDFLGIIGPNGGGKTTLIKLMLGLKEPSSGEVSVFGKKPGGCAQKIGYVPQSVSFESILPASVLDVALMGRIGISRRVGGYSREDILASEKSLRKVDMLKHRDRSISDLSGGQKQRVFIARALSSGPRLLFLDEPTASVDPAMQDYFYKLLEELKKQMAIVLISHDVGVVSAHLNKIVCVNRKVLYHGAKDLTSEQMRTLYHCPVDMISHGHPHRIIKKSEEGG